MTRMESALARRRGALLWTADAVSVALAAVAAWIILTGGGVTIVLGQLVSMHSPMRVLFLAAAVAAIRHAAAPRPSIIDHLRSVPPALAGRPDLRVALSAWILTRPTVLLVAFFAVVTIGFPQKVGFRLSADPLINLPARFDAGWYGDIALYGYQWDGTFQRQRNIAFFPALPMLIRAAGPVGGIRTPGVPRDRRMGRALWVGVAISLAAFFWALHYLARLGRDLIGPDAAASAVFLLAAYPFAVFFSAPYTEALFLLAAVGAFFHYRREQWVAASTWGLIAGLTRPNGCLLSVALAVLALQQMRAGSRSGVAVRWRPALVRLGVAAAPGVGMLLFTAYLYSKTGVWFAWARSHGAWGRSFQGLEPVSRVYEWLTTEPLVHIVTNVPYDTLNTGALLFAAALVVPVFRRLGPAYGVFVLVNVVPPFLTGGVLSMGRLTSTLFPLFLALATLIPSRSVVAWAAAFGVLQGLAAVLFFTWRELF
jgi:hypothetical protein